jgi:hypothetical protein
MMILLKDLYLNVSKRQGSCKEKARSKGLEEIL